jgi:hypothetical protein
MTKFRGRAAGLAAALALGTMALAGCGGHKTTPSNNAPAPASNNAPASQPSSNSSSSGGSGGYGY